MSRPDNDQRANPARPRGLRLLAIAPYGLLASALVVLGFTHGADIVQSFGAARPHGPDLALFAAQPLVIRIHVLAAVLALAIGAGLMVWRKGRTLHRLFGWGWVLLMATTAATSLFIVGLNGDHWSPIHGLSLLTLTLLPLAVTHARSHRVGPHKAMMMNLFYGALIVALALNFIPGRTIWRIFFG